MKNLIAIALLLCLYCSLFGCVKPQEDPPMPPEEEIPVPSQNTEPYVMPEEYVEHFAAVEATVAEINAASSFGNYKLLQLVRESEAREGSWYHADTEGNYWVGEIYPYGCGRYRITCVSIESLSNNLLGFTIHENIDEAEKVLLEYGFELTREYSTDSVYQRVYKCYGEYGIKVLLECSGGGILLERIGICILDPSDPFRDMIP